MSHQAIDALMLWRISGNQVAFGVTNNRPTKLGLSIDNMFKAENIKFQILTIILINQVF